MSQAERSRKYRAVKLADAREARELRARLERIESIYRRLAEAMGSKSPRQSVVAAIIEEMGREFDICNSVAPQNESAAIHGDIAKKLSAPAQRLIRVLRWRQAMLSMD